MYDNVVTIKRQCGALPDQSSQASAGPNRLDQVLSTSLASPNVMWWMNLLKSKGGGLVWGTHPLFQARKYCLAAPSCASASCLQRNSWWQSWICGCQLARANHRLTYWARCVNSNRSFCCHRRHSRCCSSGRACNICGCLRVRQTCCFVCGSIFKKRGVHNLSELVFKRLRAPQGSYLVCISKYTHVYIYCLLFAIYCLLFTHVYICCL